MLAFQRRSKGTSRNAACFIVPNSMPRRLSKYTPMPMPVSGRTKGLKMNKVSMVSSQLDNNQLLAALRAFRKGDFSARLPTSFAGIEGEIAEAFNDALD